MGNENTGVCKVCGNSDLRKDSEQTSFEAGPECDGKQLSSGSGESNDLKTSCGNKSQDAIADISEAIIANSTAGHKVSADNNDAVISDTDEAETGTCNESSSADSGYEVELSTNMPKVSLCLENTPTRAFSLLKEEQIRIY